jgi:hypothetical protein
MSSNLNTIFDVDATKAIQTIPLTKSNVPTVFKKPKIEQEKIDTDLLQDYETSRNNLDTLMILGQKALTDVLEIANQGQHPRFFEAAATLIEKLNQTNQNYIDIQKKIAEIRKLNMDVNGETASPVNVDKAVFVGSTAELLSLINPRKKIESANTG